MANDKKFVVKNGLQTQNISFVDSDKTNTIYARMLANDALAFSGNAGQLFSISDSLAGTIFAVNDISGVPSIEVDDDGEIRLAETFGHVLIGTDSSTDTSKHIVQITGGLNADSITTDGNITVGVGSSSRINLGTTLGSNTIVRDNTYDLSIAAGISSTNALYLQSVGDVVVSIDTNNNDTTKAFYVRSNAAKSGTEVFKVTEAGAITFNNAYTFPTADGGANQVLQTNGSGTLSFATVSSGSGLDSAGVKTVVFAAGEDLRFGDGTASDGLHIEAAANRRNFIYGEDSVRVSQMTGGPFKFIVGAPAGAGGNTFEIDANNTGGHQRINAANTNFPLDIQHGGTTKASISASAVTLNTGVDLIFEGATADANETTLTVTDPTADRTITLPNATGDVPVKLYTDITTSGNSAVNLTISNSVPNASTSAQTHLRWVVHDIAFSSGPNSPILTVATSGASVTWTGAYYNSTLNSKASFSSTDLFTGFGSFYSPRSFTLDMYQTDTNDWLVNLISDDYNGVYFLQAHATNFVPYSITISSGSSYNVTSLTGSLTEEFGVIS